MLFVGMLYNLTTLTAEASLTAGYAIADGQPVVYSSVSNITWTGDANLLGSLERAMGYDAVVNAIIAASPRIYDTPNGNDTPADSGYHDVTSSDFSSSILGRASWIGAQAFTSYLNSISYAGSNHWALPTTVDSDSSFGNNQTSSQLGQLFYQELLGTAGGTITGAPNFTNGLEAFVHWSGTERERSDGAWYFNTVHGDQGIFSKSIHWYAWAVSPGNVAAVPVPSSAWLFSSVVAGFIGFNRRKS